MIRDFQLPPPVAMDGPARTRMTVSCRDCEIIPKVDGAGGVISVDGQRIQIMHNGVKVVAGGYHGDWMMQVIEALRGHHEPQEELIFHEILKRTPSKATMIELGGFWSYYSLWFLHGHVDRSSVVVEPDPNNIAIGKANAALNGANIRFIQASVGDHCSPAREFLTETAGTILVPQVTVEELMRRCDLPELDILHCDTQGAETSVVSSCEQLLKQRKIKFGVFSTHSHHISGDPLTHQRCLQMLQDCGAVILAEHDVHESYSGDGLIAAYCGDEEISWSPPSLSRNRYSESLFRNPLFDLVECRLQKSE